MSWSSLSERGGAAIDEKDKTGRTALHVAVQLAKRTSERWERDEQRMRGRWEMDKYGEHQMKGRRKTDKYEQPLVGRGKWLGIVKVLLQKGAAPDTRDENGYTPFDGVEKLQGKSVAEFLRDARTDGPETGGARPKMRNVKELHDPDSADHTKRARHLRGDFEDDSMNETRVSSCLRLSSSASKSLFLPMP